MSKTNKDKFISELENLHYAGVGVIFIRTREENRMIKAVESLAFEHELHFRSWNTRDGWRWTDEDQRQQKEAATDSVDAMNRITATQDVNGNACEPLPVGVYVMTDIHHVLDKHPMMLRSIKEYAYELSNTEYRLIVAVPESYQIPETLMSEVSVMDFDIPSRTELSDVLDKAIRSSFVDDDENPVEYEEPYGEEDRRRILNSAIGLTAIEAETAMARSIVKNEDTWPNTPAEDFARLIMDAKVETIRRSDSLEIHEPLNPDELGGLDLYKQWMIDRKSAYTQAARDFGCRPPKGIGLFGIPGTGKSIGAKVTAHILGMPLIRFDISTVFNKWVGGTEERMKAALKQAEGMSPCVLWIDEIDKAGLSSGGDSHSSSERVLGALLNHMTESTKPVFWVFTANRVKNLPAELLRKGRLSELFNVAAPNRLEREEIIKIHLKSRKQESEGLKGWKTLLTDSVGYVGAELEAAVNDAVTLAFTSGEPITGKTILDQLKQSVPLVVAFKDDCDSMSKWAQESARPSSTPDEEDEEKQSQLASVSGERKIRKVKTRKKILTSNE